ncbi:Ref family recombination enhancement nuclease [Burkholderia ubonensis]|uniref:Ref family recombination enhancement nuclease n=1 Tax=Burkholderia ubonensis TaxID=101571 RepID=UPI001E32DC43|nr:Ref family recombination enhancement nuclease [Burkholderia ubonensis]
MPEADAKTAKRQAGIRSRVKKRATAAEREHMGVVAGMCCVVCRNLGFGDSPAEVHHVRYLAGGGQRASNMDTIPLCPPHHRLGGWGVAYHAGPEEFERRYGTEADLLKQTKQELGIEMEAA